MSVRLSWINRVEADEIRVYRDTATIDPNSLPAPLATIAGTALEYTDDAVSDGTTYFYRVAAVLTSASPDLVAVSAEISVLASGGAASPSPSPSPSPSAPGSLRANVFYDDIGAGSVKVAWGLRKLVSTWTGNLIRIRDTNDDSEQDVGFDADGNLASFSVVGDARVVTVYDQTGGGDHLVATSTTNQPTLQRSAITNRWEIKLNGVTQFLRSTFTSASSPAGAWAVARPIYFWRGTGYGTGGESFSVWWAVVHNDGANVNPFFRTAMQRNSSAITAIQFWRADPSNVSANLAPVPYYGRSHGLVAWHPYEDVIRDFGTDGYAAPGASGSDVTYPSTARVYVGASGTGANNPNNSFEEFVITDGNGISTATFNAAVDALYEEGITPATGVTLDLPFTTALGVADQSSYSHQVELVGLSAPSADYLDLDGTNWAFIAPHESFGLGTDWTIELDLWLDATTANRRIIGCHAGDDNDRGWELATWNSAGDELMFIVGDRSSAGNFCVTGTDGPAADLTTGTWYSIVIQRVGATVTIDVDGVEKANKVIGSAQDSGSGLFIGNGVSGSLGFDGRIRNFKITRNTL